jgi:hypothetical protein
MYLQFLLKIQTFGIYLKKILIIYASFLIPQVPTLFFLLNTKQETDAISIVVNIPKNHFH